MTPRGRAGTSLCALVFVALSLGGAPRAARAQLDMTGPWDAQAPQRCLENYFSPITSTPMIYKAEDPTP